LTFVTFSNRGDISFLIKKKLNRSLSSCNVGVFCFSPAKKKIENAPLQCWLILIYLILNFLMMWQGKSQLLLTCQCTFTDVVVDIFLPHEQKVNTRRSIKNRQHCKGPFLKKNCRGKAKHVYIAEGKDIFTL
jgi:hypothetical protein